MEAKELIELFASELEYEGNKLLPIQVKWLVDSFFERHPEAINYSRSSLQLKDKETMTFEEYLEENKLSKTYIWLSRKGLTDLASEIHEEWLLTKN